MSFRPDSSRAPLNGVLLLDPFDGWPLGRCLSNLGARRTSGMPNGTQAKDREYPPSTGSPWFQLDVSQYYVIRTIIILDGTSGAWGLRISGTE
jgi:hypothetical protein